MKLFIVFILLFSGLSSFADDVTPPENRAVVVRFFGGFTGFDPDAYRVVRSSMASLLAEGIIDHFITTSWGREGGVEFCVQLGQDPSLSVDRIVNMLIVIHPGNNSIYEHELQPSCVAP